jgi:hypothetical protein
MIELLAIFGLSPSFRALSVCGLKARQKPMRTNGVSPGSKSDTNSFLMVSFSSPFSAVWAGLFSHPFLDGL